MLELLTHFTAKKTKVSELLPGRTATPRLSPKILLCSGGPPSCPWGLSISLCKMGRVVRSPLSQAGQGSLF